MDGVESPLFEGPFFKEFAVGYKSAKAEDVYERLARKGIMAGYPLTRRLPGIGEAGGYCVTEVHSSDDISRLVRRLEGGALSVPRKFRQAQWDEPLLKELSRKGRTGFVPPKDEKIEAWSTGKELHPGEPEEEGRAQAPRDRGAAGPEALQQALADELLRGVGDLPARELHHEVQPQGLRVHRVLTSA